MSSGSWRHRLLRLFFARQTQARRTPEEEQRERARAERQARDHEKLIKLLAQAQHPETSAEELRYAYHSMPGLSLFLSHSIFPSLIEMAEALSSHANIPTDILLELIQDLQWEKAAHTGFLRNPILPLLFLEMPDFLSRLEDSDGEKFALPMLRRTDLPPILLRMLANHDNPWIALEARTHILAMPEEDPPDLDWLDDRVCDLLGIASHDERTLYWELAERGVVPVWDTISDPCKETDFEEQMAAIPSELVEEIAQEANRRVGWLQRGRAEWLFTCHATGNPRFKDINIVDFRIRLFQHPDIPIWALAAARQWLINVAPILLSQSEPNLEKDILTTFRRSLASHPRANRFLRTLCRKQAINSGLRSSHGLFYLVLREIPEGLAIVGQLRVNILTLYSLYQRRALTHDFLDKTSTNHFLHRLAIALRLKPNHKVHDKVRAKLQNDPNRYVRAAARGQLSFRGR